MPLKLDILFIFIQSCTCNSKTESSKGTLVNTSYTLCRVHTWPVNTSQRRTCSETLPNLDLCSKELNSIRLNDVQLRLQLSNLSFKGGAALSANPILLPAISHASPFSQTFQCGRSIAFESCRQCSESIFRAVLRLKSTPECCSLGLRQLHLQNLQNMWSRGREALNFRLEIIWRASCSFSRRSLTLDELYVCKWILSVFGLFKTKLRAPAWQVLFRDSFKNCKDRTYFKVRMRESCKSSSHWVHLEWSGMNLHILMESAQWWVLHVPASIQGRVFLSLSTGWLYDGFGIKSVGITSTPFSRGSEMVGLVSWMQDSSSLLKLEWSRKSVSFQNELILVVFAYENFWGC